jgi:hypothetical protein
MSELDSDKKDELKSDLVLIDFLIILSGAECGIIIVIVLLIIATY